MLDITIPKQELDGFTAELMELPGVFFAAKKRALSSIGYHVQQALKVAKIEPELNPHTGVLARTRDRWGRRRWVKYSRRRYKSGPKKGLVIPRLSKRKEPFSRLKNAIRYEVDAEDNFVAIGLLSASRFYSIMRKQTTGFTIPVTPRMRRMMFGVGFPLKRGTTHLRVPARPLFEKVWAQKKAEVIPLFEKKFYQHIEEKTSKNRYIK